MLAALRQVYQAASQTREQVRSAWPVCTLNDPAINYVYGRAGVRRFEVKELPLQKEV